MTEATQQMKALTETQKTLDSFFKGGKDIFGRTKEAQLASHIMRKENPELARTHDTILEAQRREQNAQQQAQWAAQRQGNGRGMRM